MRAKPAIWLPEIAPDVVTLDASDLAGALPLPHGSETLVEFATGTKLHTIIAVSSARLRLCVRLVQDQVTPTLTIPCDGSCELRIAAAARFQRMRLGQRCGTDRSAQPSTYQRARWIQFLRLHDALEAGASSRDIAFDLILPNHRPLSGAVWKGSSERRQVLRLIADARRLVTSGYRTLLLHR